VATDGGNAAFNLAYGRLVHLALLLIATALATLACSTMTPLGVPVESEV